MIGIDVVRIDRIRTLLARSPRFAERFFTPEERDYCRASNDPALHLAGTLAGKEAVMKALRLTPAPAWMRRVEIVREPQGAPVGRAVGREIALSISHEADVAVAVAIDLTRA